MNPDLVYPIYPHAKTAMEKLALRIRLAPIYCPVCGKFTLTYYWNENFRESGICIRCHSTNRQRQMGKLLSTIVSQELNKNYGSLRQLIHDETFKQFRIHNTEATGSVHRQLANSPLYTASEYLGQQYKPGEIVNNIRNEDLQNLSFNPNTFDYILSSDVFEHIPNPYLAHKEVFRVLRPGGRHIFTVPFHQTDFKDEVFAEIVNDELTYLKPPVYHHDPIRPEGVLLFTVFSLEMLLKLQEIGFRTHMHRIYRPSNGILGPNGIIFEAIKSGPTEQ